MYVGVDVGTTITKAVVFDAQGEAVSLAARPTRLLHPNPSWVEQDTGEVVDSVAEVVRDAAQEATEARPGEPVEVLAITGQGDGCWLVDGDGNPVRNAVSWMDGRAAAIVDTWLAAGLERVLFQVNGNTIFPGAMAPILAWLDRHEPDVLDRAATAAYCKDVVMQRLTGLRATDASDASLPFSDPATDGYSAKVLAETELTARAGLLAPITRPLPQGELHGQGAAMVGLAEGTPVVTGPFDLPACARGGGVVTPGDGLIIIGTTLACQVLTDRIDTSGDPTGMHLATATEGRWLRAMPAMVGTASLDWLLRLTGMDVSELDGALRASPPGARGVEALPYMSPSGERAPFVDPYARGQLTGLSLETGREDVVRALCESIAYAGKHCFEAAGLTGKVVACGGGTKSSAWLQIFADVLQRPLEIARGPEVGARGVVVQALALTGNDGDVAAWTAPERVVEPDPAAAGAYADGYARYLAHVEAARPLWARTAREVEGAPGT